MVRLYHLNCVDIDSPIGIKACGHCLLLEQSNKLILVDTGIGLEDIRNPEKRIGNDVVCQVGLNFDENQTAFKQIQQLGFDPANVTDCVISHLDFDHIGGLADFPNAKIHLSSEEIQNFNANNSRYLKTPLSHQPSIQTYSSSYSKWFGFESRKVKVDIEAEVYLIPLFGHTWGHCGVAIQINSAWIFYVADAYYLRSELINNNHTIHAFAALRADDNDLRIKSLFKIAEFIKKNPRISTFSYHDPQELQLKT